MRGTFDNNGEATFGCFDWDVTGEDLINGVVQVGIAVADASWQLHDSSPRPNEVTEELVWSAGSWGYRGDGDVQWWKVVEDNEETV